ncbi:MAG: DNA polymerase III subunit gamma/tau, partial [Chitinophagaceae bacterium]
VDDIRSLVEQVRFAPQAGRYKVYIIDEVHMLSSSAFNAFLKTLEEPPPYAIFILATTEKHKILPTILSRCQIFDFKRITTADTIEHLQEICEKEQITAEKPALHVIAQKSEGCMRDSLSILDKIVSFTDGKLTYANTLEHLNILDEDYYFQLLENLHTQELSSALLLLDNILQKGFEADAFLEGFTEFVRNLLVSKDAKAISLLEVADDFKDKYLTWSQKTELGWILAALNILTEAGMGYKMARNKRLFTEMVVIKLSYLNQALELQPNAEGLSKKKRVEDAKPVAFRALNIRAAKQEPGANIPKPAGALAVPLPVAPAVSYGKSLPKAQPATASLIVEEPSPVITPTAAQSLTIPAPEVAPVSIGSLKSIREKIARQYSTASTSLPLNIEALTACWKQYMEILKTRKQHSTVSNFSMADLQVLDENCFQILVANSMQRKFIETERAGLIEHLMKYFNNRGISYKFAEMEDDETEDDS